MQVLVSEGTITITTLDEDNLLASIAELVAQQTTQTAAMQEIASDVQGLLANNAALMAQVQALQDQLVTGGGIQPSELDPILATMQAQQAQLDSIAAAVPPPVTP